MRGVLLEALLSLGLKITPFAMRIWIHMKEPRQKIFRGMESNKDSSLEWCCQVEIEPFHLGCNFSEKMKFCWYRTSGVGENWIFFFSFPTTYVWSDKSYTMKNHYVQFSPQNCCSLKAMENLFVASGGIECKFNQLFE